MKLKNIAAALTFVVALGVSTSVYAATEVKIGDVTDANGTVTDTFATLDDEIKVPILINTTDESWDKVGAYDLTIEFNNEKLYIDSIENGMKYRKYNRTGTSYTLEASGSVTPPDFDTANENGKFSFNWVSTSQTSLADTEVEATLIMYPNVANYTFDPSDIKIKVNQLVATENVSGSTNELIYADSFATYVTFEIPADYTENGYVHEVYLVLGDKEYQLKNCIATETGYKFITSITNSSDAKKAVDAKVVLKTAATEDATEFTDVEYLDLGTIQIEKF